jgi:hypothetical protein
VVLYREALFSQTRDACANPPGRLLPAANERRAEREWLMPLPRSAWAPAPDRRRRQRRTPIKRILPFIGEEAAFIGEEAAFCLTYGDGVGDIDISKAQRRFLGALPGRRLHRW